MYDKARAEQERLIRLARQHDRDGFALKREVDTGTGNGYILNLAAAGALISAVVSYEEFHEPAGYSFALGALAVAGAVYGRRKLRKASIMSSQLVTSAEKTITLHRAAGIKPPNWTKNVLPEAYFAQEVRDEPNSDTAEIVDLIAYREIRSTTERTKIPPTLPPGGPAPA